MKKITRILSAAALAGALALTTAAPSFAMTADASQPVGHHVACMATEGHPVTHGGLHFSECVRALAKGLPCPHE